MNTTNPPSTSNDSHINPPSSSSHSPTTTPPKSDPPRFLPLSKSLIPTLPASGYYIPSFLTRSEETSLLTHILSAPRPQWKYLSHRRLQAYPSVLSPGSNTLIDRPLPSWLEDVAGRIVRVCETVGGAGDGDEEHENTAGDGQRDGDMDKDGYMKQGLGEEDNKKDMLDKAEGIGIWKHTPHHRPNHVLVNEYQPGQGIAMHEDGAAYAPVVATVTLGAYGVLDVVRKRDWDGPLRHYRSHDEGVKRGGDDDDSPGGGEEGKGGEGVRQKMEECDQREDIREEAGEGVHKWRILQERCSLLVTTGDVYRRCLHGIEAVDVDEGLHGGVGGIVNWDLLGDQEVFRDGRAVRETRISLTFRDVVKVKKLGKAFGGLGR